MVAAVALLALAAPAGAQTTPGDTLPLDSVFVRAGPVLRWNVAARLLIERALTARDGRPARPTFYDGNNNTRLYGLVAGAQYDALRASPDSTFGTAAAITAAATVLATVFPRDSGWIARRRAAELAALSAGGGGGPGLAAAARAGRKAALPWVADARAELRVVPWRGRAPAGPGRWRGEREVPALAISLGLPPRYLASRDQLRPPPPPELGSPAFGAALDSVRSATAQRTRQQTRATWTWARNAATLWSEIAGGVIVRRRLPEPAAARALMALNLALSDATIACWDAKLYYWYPRPSQMDSTLDLSVPLPDFPSYPSAHATLFATGAAVLGHLVPEEQGMLDSLAAEATRSRVWAGVHYPFDNAAGTTLGRGVAGSAIAALDAGPATPHPVPARSARASPPPRTADRAAPATAR
jgi:membrane-associated phospholipid phosphatase